MSQPPPPFAAPTPASEPEPPIDQARLARNWRAITVELDAPRPSRFERTLRRLGMPDDVTRVMSATPALRRSWFIALTVILLLGLALADPAQPRSSAFGLLLLAPLAPVLGVSLSYGVANDPAHELHLATPMSGIRLLLTRTAAMMCVAIPVITLVALISEITRPWAAAWLLPALAVSAVALALMTVVPPRLAAGSTAAGWVLVNLIVRAVSDDALGAFVPAAQLVATAVLLVASLVITSRRSSFERLAPS